MRTTVELPSDLMRAAKARAAAEGRSLKDFLARAVAHELGSSTAPVTRGRVTLPLIGPVKPSVEVSNEDIEAALADDDVQRYSAQ